MIEEPEEIIELFLEASGIKKPEKRKEYQKKLDDIILDFKSVNPDVLNQDSLVIAERLFDYMYGKKQYVLYNSSPFLNEVIDAFLDDSNKGGIGDCVGICAFYASLAPKLGVHLNVYFKLDFATS